MKMIRVACRCKGQKTHRLAVEAGLLGRYAMWLCDGCYDRLENKDLLINYDELEQKWTERDFRCFIQNFNDMI